MLNSKTAIKSLVALGLIGILAGCQEESKSSTRDQGKQEQENVMQTARANVPTYVPSNFLTREAVDKWMQRMDTPNKTFYVYLLGDNGNHIGYYVAQTRPICSSTLLTPPDQVHYWRGASSSSTTAVTSAPSLDGVYSGGECSSHFFFDAETDAYIEISGLNFFTSDQPLNVNSEALNVQVN